MTPDVPEDPTATVQPPAPLPLRIGDHRIIRKIGEGGMGVVYEAEQQHPKRVVALKVIRGGGFVDDLRVRMFQREAQALARLKHPGIAAIYESGRTEDGQHFFAMELVRGETLHDFIQRRREDGAQSPLALRERLALFRKVCDAVNYAHQRGVIHRDLKPSNIIVLREPPLRAPGETGPVAPDVKVLDFGLARITDTDVLMSTLITDAGRVLGTYPYMSPEQVRGNPDEIDLRADVYSLGVILYELVTGRLPFDLRHARLPEAMRVICEEPPRPPGLTWSGTRLDRDLGTIVLKALEKEPARRYQGAAALAEDLQRYLADLPIQARPPSAAYQLRKLVARHKAPFAFVATLFVVLAAFAATMAVQAGRIARERDRANREAQTAGKVSEFLVGLFQVADPGEARGNNVTAREILDQGAERIEWELKEQPLIQARLLDTIGQVYKSLGLYERAQPLLERALSIRRAALGEESVEVAESLNSLGVLYRDQGRQEEALQLNRRALAIKERVLPQGDTGIAWSAYYLGDRSNLERALAIFEKNLGHDTLPVSWCLNDLGMAVQEARDFSAARPLFERALRIKEKVLPPHHPDIAMALNNLGYLLIQMGEYDESRLLFERALAEQERVLGPEHPVTAMTLQSLGEMWLLSGDPARAEPILKRALGIQLNTQDSGSKWLSGTQHTLAMALRDLGRYGESEPFFKSALAAREKVGGPDNPMLAETLQEYSKLMRATGRKTEAESLEARARAIRDRNEREKSGGNPADR